MFKIKLCAIMLFLLSVCATAQETKKPTIKNQTVEASCGQCQFGKKGDGCDLAVRIGGKTYFVTGTHIDKHGDAHAKDGFCATIRKAEVSGSIVANRFVASSFKLLPNQN